MAQTVGLLPARLMPFSGSPCQAASWSLRSTETHGGLGIGQAVDPGSALGASCYRINPSPGHAYSGASGLRVSLAVVRQALAE